MQKATALNVMHEHYVAQLNEARKLREHTPRRIGQKHHKVSTIKSVNRLLCTFDDKAKGARRKGTRATAHGHYRTREKQTLAEEDDRGNIASDARWLDINIMIEAHEDMF